MGRFIKNRELRSASYSIRAPYGSSAVGPSSPVDGLFRLNSTTGKFEYYTHGSWRVVSIEGTTAITKDSFMGDGSTTSYTISIAYSAGQEANMIIFVGNVFQNPGVVYTVAGNTLTFTAPPNSGQPIIVLHGYASTAITL